MILLSGYHNPYYLTVTEYIENAIRSLGNELVVFNDRDHVLPGRLRKKMRIIQNISIAAINRNLFRLAKNTEPEIILVIGGHRITAKCLKALRNSRSRLVLWTTDPPRQSDIMFSTAPFYDYIFCQGTEYIEALERSGNVDPQWLPMACDPKVHHRVNLTNEEIRFFGKDIAFVGSYYPRRAAILEQLPDINLGIWGPGWENLPLNSPLRSSVVGSHTTPEIWCKIYSASKIVLSIHYQNQNFPVYQASPRVFEALACGAFVISDNQKDVFSLLKESKHLVGFKTIDDLVRKIKYYLYDSEERDKIASCGKQEVLRKHTYVNRVHKLISVVKPNQIPV